MAKRLPLETALTMISSSLGLTTAIGATILIARLYSISGMNSSTAVALAGHADFGTLLFVLFVSTFPTILGLAWAAGLVVAVDRAATGRGGNPMLTLSVWAGAVAISALVPLQWGALAGPLVALIYGVVVMILRRGHWPWADSARLWARSLALVIIGAAGINAIFLNERPLGQGVLVTLAGAKDRSHSDGSVVGYILSSSSDSVTLLQHRPRQVLLLRPADIADIDACTPYRGSAEKTILQQLIAVTGGSSSRITGPNAPFCFPHDIP